MKKAYETPEVTKVQFDASDRITASVCTGLSDSNLYGGNNCKD